MIPKKFFSWFVDVFLSREGRIGRMQFLVRMYSILFLAWGAQYLVWKFFGLTGSVQIDDEGAALEKERAFKIMMFICFSVWFMATFILVFKSFGSLSARRMQDLNLAGRNIFNPLIGENWSMLNNTLLQLQLIFKEGVDPNEFGSTPIGIFGRNNQSNEGK